MEYKIASQSPTFYGELLNQTTQSEGFSDIEDDNFTLYFEYEDGRFEITYQDLYRLAEEESKKIINELIDKENGKSNK